jgi:hypothetical protein
MRIPPEKTPRETIQRNHPEKPSRETIQRNHPEKPSRETIQRNYAGCGLTKKGVFFRILNSQTSTDNQEAQILSEG